VGFRCDLWLLIFTALGFFGDMALKRITNLYKVWRDILNREKMMDGEALMVLLEWTIYGFSSEKKTRPTGVTKQDVTG